MKFKFSVSLCLCVERIMIVLRHIPCEESVSKLKYQQRESEAQRQEQNEIQILCVSVLKEL